MQLKWILCVPLRLLWLARLEWIQDPKTKSPCSTQQQKSVPLKSLHWAEYFYAWSKRCSFTLKLSFSHQSSGGLLYWRKSLVLWVPRKNTSEYKSLQSQCPSPSWIIPHLLCLRNARAFPLLPAALASVPFGFVLVRVLQSARGTRINNLRGLGGNKFHLKMIN